MDGLSLTGARWALAPVDDGAVARLRARGMGAAAARILALRFPDVGDPEALTASADHLLDPRAMRSMDAALERLERALRDDQHVRIITDYDVDGTTSSLILQAALKVRRPGARISYHIPSRFGEGYGFSVAAADAAAADGVDLIVTADIGVRDHAAISRAREAGVDVLVCDHHLPAGAAVPTDAIVLCPPQEACSYPNPYLAACGISLKVAQGLLEEHPKRRAILASMLKLAAIGTVADMVPLTSLENRAIVTLGLAELNRGPHHAGLDALLKAAALSVGEIKDQDLGFRLGPRINAAGRVAEADLVVRLLTSRDRGEAERLAGELERHNSERKTIQRRLVDAALASIPDPVPAFVVVSGPEADGWHRGVVGIVAARVKDEVHRPAAVVSIQGEYAVGSVRSTPSVHAVRALDGCADLLVKYGGHPAAAGFTVRAADLGALQERLAAFVDANTEDLLPVREVDVEVAVQDVDLRLAAEVAALGPFGQGNPRPVLLVRGAQVMGRPRIMASGRLVKLMLARPGGGSVEAIWWGAADHVDALSGTVDLLGNLGVNTWRGSSTAQLELRDARPVG